MVLGRLGYAVTAVTESRKALNLFRDNPDKFDLLITDQVMPHMTGVTLSKEILKIRPDLPIVLCTGSSPQAETAVGQRQAREVGIRKVLMKPVERNEISQVVQKLLQTEPVSSVRE